MPANNGTAAGGPKIPAKVRPTYEAVVTLTDPFCRKHLNDEYAELCRELTEVLCCKRPTPLTSGKAASWACGIVRTIGWVNFLSDPSQTPHMKAQAVNEGFGVSPATAAAKLKRIRDLLKLAQLDPAWTLPSQLADNPLAWDGGGRWVRDRCPGSAKRDTAGTLQARFDPLRPGRIGRRARANTCTFLPWLLCRIREWE